MVTAVLSQTEGKNKRLGRFFVRIPCACMHVCILELFWLKNWGRGAQLSSLLLRAGRQQVNARHLLADAVLDDILMSRSGGMPKGRLFLCRKTF